MAALWPSSHESLCWGVIFTRKSSCGQSLSGRWSVPFWQLPSPKDERHQSPAEHLCSATTTTCCADLPAGYLSPPPACPLLPTSLLIPASLTSAVVAKCPVSCGMGLCQRQCPVAAPDTPLPSLPHNCHCQHPQWHFCAGPCATHNSQQA